MKRLWLVLLVLAFVSCSKKETEKTSVIGNDTEVEQSIIEIDEIEQVEKISSSSFDLWEIQEMQELLEMSKFIGEESEYIFGDSFELLGGTAKTWKIYENINAKYSSETIEKEYFKTDYSIAKIYLYWILRERSWHNLSKIHEDLLKRGSEVIYFAGGGGCIPYSVLLRNIIMWPFKKGDIYVEEKGYYGLYYSRLFEESIKKELALETNFIGKYVFYSINIEENENVDISKYKDIDESIYIEIKKVDTSKYTLETNSWLINSIRTYSPPVSIYAEPEPILFERTDWGHNIWDDGELYSKYRERLFENGAMQAIFSKNNNYITFNYFHFKPVGIDYKTIKGLDNKTFNYSYFSREKEVIKCSIVFKKIET